MRGINSASFADASRYPAWLRATKCVSRVDVRLLYEESHVKRVYEQTPVSLTPNPGGVVLDIGANVGMFATRAAEALGDQALVIAVEPWQQATSCLEHNIQYHRDWCAQKGANCAQIKVIQSGVGDGSTNSASFTFYPHASGWGTCSKYQTHTGIAQDMQAFIKQSMQTTEQDVRDALYSPMLKQLAVFLQAVSPKLFSFAVQMAVSYLTRDARMEVCPMCTVSDIIEQNDIKTVTLLKIDVERSELDVLSGIKEEHWDRIYQVAMECHEVNLIPACQILYAANFQNVTITQTSDLQSSGIFMVHCSK